MCGVKTNSIIIALIAFAFASSFSLDAKTKKSDKFLSIEHGPWITNVSENSFDVLFTTADKTLAWVEVKEDDGNTWYKEVRPRFFQTVSGRRLAGTLHKIHISGLKPGTSYAYRLFGKKVLDDKSAYAIKYGPEQGTAKALNNKTVKTLTTSADTCRFSMVNDMHFNADKYRKLMSGMPKNNDFIVLCGDIVSHSSSIDSVIKYSFDPVKDILPSYPLFFARGNHESRGADWYKVPGVFPTSTGEFYYTFRFGPVAFLVLDAGEDKYDSSVEYSGTAEFDAYRAAELEWLKKAVKDPKFVSAPKKVCLMHIPTRKLKSAWYAQEWISNNFLPVLNEAGVCLMLSGHHHKFIHDKKGEFGNKYDIVANSNVDRLDFEGTAKGIKLTIVGLDGKVVHTIEL